MMKREKKEVVFAIQDDGHDGEASESKRRANPSGAAVKGHYV
jgi:hypothetical protein